MNEQKRRIPSADEACDYLCYIREVLEVAKASGLEPETIAVALERIPLIYLHISSREHERVTGERDW